VFFSRYIIQNEGSVIKILAILGVRSKILNFIYICVLLGAEILFCLLYKFDLPIL
jgi:hypothetical protein